MCLMIQDVMFDRFMKRMGDEALGSGFLARSLISFPESTQGFRFTAENELGDVSGVTAHPFHNRVRTLLRDYQRGLQEARYGRQVLCLSPDAKQAWLRFDQALESQLGPGGVWADIPAFAAKAGENVLRLAGSLQYFEMGSGVVEVQAMHAAQSMVLWHLGEAKRAFGEVPPEVRIQQDAQALVQRLRQFAEYGTTTVSKSYLLRYGPSQLRRRNLLDPVLWFLAQAGQITIYIERRTEMIRLSYPGWW